MDRADALRIFDQIIAAGYGCEIRATNVTEQSGAQYEVGISIAGWRPHSTLSVLQDIADSNGADTYFAVDSSPQVRAYLVISTPKRRPEYGHGDPGGPPAGTEDGAQPC